MPHEGEKDKDVPQWLNFTFKKKKKVVLPKVTLQQAIIEEPRKTKRARTVHHLSRIGSGEVIVDVAVPTQAEGQDSPKYQVSQVKLGKQTKWGELHTLELATSVIRGRIEKEHISHSKVKAQPEQYKQLLLEMGKFLDTCIDDNLPSTSSLPEGDTKALVEVRQVAATAKAWARTMPPKLDYSCKTP